MPLEVTAGGGTGALPLTVPRRETWCSPEAATLATFWPASDPTFMKALVRLSVFAVKFLVSPPRLVVYSLF
jgi:hypothetical protein